MFQDCAVHIAALKNFAARDNASAHLITPIISIFEKIFDQLKLDEVNSIGKLDGKEFQSPARLPRQLLLHPLLEMAEKCDEHIAAIRNYLVDKPDSAHLLHPIVSNFEAIVAKLGQKEVELIDKLNRPNPSRLEKFADSIMLLYTYPDILILVIGEATDFQTELINHKETITRKNEDDYHKMLRARIFVQSDMVLSKCLRRLNYVQVQVEKDVGTRGNKKNKEKIESDLSKAISKLTSFGEDLKGCETPKDGLKFFRANACKTAKGKMSDAINIVVEAEKLLPHEKRVFHPSLPPGNDP